MQEDDASEDYEPSYAPTEPGESRVPEANEEDDELFRQPSDQHASVTKAKDFDPMVCIPCGNARVPSKLTSPILPSAEAVDEHCMTHFPYRNWCPPCVQAKGKEGAHNRGVKHDEDETGLPIVSFDYQSMSVSSDKELKVLIGKDEGTGNLIGHTVICKGLADEWVIRRVVRDLQEIGRGHCIIKTDGEPSIVAVQNRLQTLRQGRTVPRNPPAYNPASNGPCEKAVQDVCAHLRAIKLGLEARLKMDIDDFLPIVQWALEHAVFLINKFSVGEDGMTPYERATGRKWRRAIVEFGEMVLAKLALRRNKRGSVKGQKRKLAKRSVEGVWVGQVARTGEHIVIKPSGDAVRCRTIRRLPTEHRWQPERVLTIRATPRLPSPSTATPEAMESRLVDEEVEVPPAEGQAVPPISSGNPRSGATMDMPEHRPRELDIREFRINERILEKYGYSLDCGGCSHKQQGLPGHSLHTPECRDRLRALMETDAADKRVIEESRRRQREGKAVTPMDFKDGEKTDEAAAPSVGPADPLSGARTPRFGDNNEPDEKLRDGTNPESDVEIGDEIPELQYESDEEMGEDTGETGYPHDDPLADHKRKFDDEDEDDDGNDDEPSGKRQKVKSLIPTVKPPTMVGRAMCGDTPTPQRSNMLAAEARTNVDIKEIIRRLEKDPSLQPSRNRRQRRTVQQRGEYDVAEVYSPPRITEMARRMGLKDGWALDLTVVDPDDGQPWNFENPDKCKKAIKMLDRDQPMMLIVCPMCGPFSKLQEVFNYPKMAKADVEEKLKAALQHLRFAIELCIRQRDAGRLFLFEHPASASSWYTELVKYLASLSGVFTAKFDFCMLGMTTTGAEGEVAAAKKRTGVITNSSAIASILRDAQCRGEHKHEQLLDGKAGPCQKYPDKFCRLICEGIRREMDTVEWKNRMKETFDISTSFGKVMALQAKEELATPPEEDPFHQLYEDGEFVDDVSGMPLEKGLAIKARRLEVEYFKKMGVYTKVRREGWMRVITTRWLDVNKGDEANPDYRSRLVGREIKKDRRDDLFAATPPLESLRMLLSICASSQGNMDEAKNFVVMSNDIKRAYFYAPVTRPVYIAIPREDNEDGDEEMVGQLNLSLYGTRDAALNWAKTYSEFLVSIGFQKGRGSPCNFFHATRGISTTVHGDDFSSTGTESDLRWMDGQLKSKFEVKTNVLGPGRNHERQLRVLNRVLTWNDDGISYEPDQRHAEIIIETMQVAKAVTTPGSRDDAAAAGPPNVTTTKTTPIPPGKQDFHSHDLDYDRHNDYTVNVCVEAKAEDGCDPPLGTGEASRYRALAARANYLAQDRPDIQFAVKEIARRMATPCGRDWALLKRLARYLVGAPRGVTHFYWQTKPSRFDVFVDSDWAGCKATARSTSGGAAKFGWHTIKTWSTTQTVIALSSGEAELFSLTKGAAQTLGLISLARDLGLELEGTLHTDANAAIGIAAREGLGKVRHLNVQYLWIQDRVRGGDIKLSKVPGPENPADLLTKHLAAADVLRHLETLCCTLHSSRADIAPSLQAVSTVDADDNGQDHWESNEEQATRHHVRPRRCLFTPTRVAAAPPAKSLTGTRVTVGRFVDTGELFRVADNWTARATAHTPLQRLWTGKTTFWRRVEL